MRVPSLARSLILVFLPAAVAVAGDGKDASKASAAGPEIAWARTWAEAKEEATERNVAVFLHSHGST
jgi:hypothetical protein